MLGLGDDLTCFYTMDIAASDFGSNRVDLS